MYNNNFNFIESLIVCLIWEFYTKVGVKPIPDVTVFPCTGFWDYLCLCMKLSITVPEVVSLMDTFMDTISLHFKTRSSIQIRILEVVSYAWSLILIGTKWSHWSTTALIFSFHMKQIYIQWNIYYPNIGADIVQGSCQFFQTNLRYHLESDWYFHFIA